MRPCPQCFSRETEIIDYLGIRCLRCKKCGFDESSLYEVYPSQKSSQKAKGQFSPYKAGGQNRAKNL